MTLPKEVRLIIVEQMVKHASPTKIIQYFKTFKIFQVKPGSLQELRSTAKDAIRNVNENMLTAVIANFCKIIDACIQEKRGHFENIMNSK